MSRSILCLQLVLRTFALLILASFFSISHSDVVYGQVPQTVTTTVEKTLQGAVASITIDHARSPYHPSRALVRFRDGVRDFLPGSGAARALAANGNLFLVPNPPGRSVAEVVKSYKANPNVLYAEPDYEVRTSEAFPNDPRWLDQWDMMKIAAPLAWNSQTDASDTVVAIVDTGIDFTHPDLQGNIWSGQGFTCINSSCVAGGQDDHGHGTHVAGAIGARGNNGMGIAGANWYVQLIAFKFLDSGGSGYTSDAVAAFQKILDLKKIAGVNIRVTNNSWGGGSYSQALKDAMAAVEAAGIVNVCAAGNSGQNADLTPMYPAAYENRGIVSVLAADSNDAGAGFTNYGLFSVDLAAPGVNTLSTVPAGTCALCDTSSYKYLSGTSMATPHVSGVLAALIHQNPLLTAAEARDIILDPGSYDAMTDARARNSSTGGRLNFSKTISNSRLNPPITLNKFPTLAMGPDIFAAGGTPVNLTATASDADAADNANLRMAWTKLVSTSSTWLFGWMADSLFPNPSASSEPLAAPVVARNMTVEHYASVSDNRGGGASGRQRVTVSATPGQIGPPTGELSLSATSAPVGGTITVAYQPVDPDGKGQAAWDLWVAGSGGASGACCYTSSSTSLTFSSAGVYRIGVQAIDRALDLSARKTAVVTIGNATGIPPIASATLDKLDGPTPLSINIDMSGSSDADGNIQYYFMDCGGGAFTAGSRASGATCTFDAPGVYWLLLQVQDNSGLVDVISAYVVATPVNGSGSAPAPPTSLTAKAGDAKVTLTWAASTGATSYNVKGTTTSGGPYTQVATASGTSFTDTGLINGTTYYYVVSALNGSGESGNSAQVSAKPLAVPLAPTGLTAKPGDGQITLKWTASASATSYNLRRGTSSGIYSTLIEGVAETTYVDTGLNNGSQYYYVVLAVNASGQSASSAEVSAIPMAVPTGLTAMAGDTKVTLTWKTSFGANSYNVKRGTKPGGPYSTIAQNYAATSYIDTGVSNGTTYYYVVSALNAYGESSNSTPASATPAAVPSAPTLQSLALAPSTIKGGLSLKVTVTISQAALSGGVIVNLSSSNSNVVPVPLSLTVPQGATSAFCNVKTKKVTSNQEVRVTATLNGISKQQSVVVTR